MLKEIYWTLLASQSLEEGVYLDQKASSYDFLTCFPEE